jgi:ABC-type dipeptide/oligopeptide/nickel transport system permease subunit
MYVQDLGRVAQYSTESSRTTHGTAEAVDACRLLGVMIAMVLRGESKETILFHAQDREARLILAIGALMSPRSARVAHGPTLSVREKEFVLAVRALGASDARLLRHHTLPNIFGELPVMASLWTATAIRIEANLSFIGLGVPPPTPTWGNMIRDRVKWLTNAPYLSVFPGLAILITVLAFNMVGDGLRDVADPKLQV